MTALPLFRNAHLLGAVAALFVLPNALFAAYLATAPMALLLAGTAASLAIAAVRRSPPQDSFLGEPLSWARLGVCAAIAAVLILLAGGDHLLYTNWDWLFRDAVLADVGRTSDLPTYAVDGRTFVLRAPLGMYLLPALAARLVTLGVGHTALFAQNTCILAGILYVLAGLSSQRWPIVIVVFVGFSGLDIAGLYFWRWELGQSLAPSSLPSQIEGWTAFQYSSHVTQLFWVPNHCLPGWWLAAMALLCARREIAVGDFGLALSASLLWSPLAVAGALPLAAACLVCRLHDTVHDPRSWLSTVAALGFIPIAIYLVGDSGQVPHEILVGHPDFWILASVFLATEIPQAAIVVWAWSSLAAPLRMLLAPTIATLVLLPMIRIGSNNDLIMRGSIPPLAVLAFAFAETLAQGWHRQPTRFAIASMLALVGAVTPAFELIRPLIFSGFKISDCNLVTAGNQAAPGQVLTNYLARPDKMQNGLLRPSVVNGPLPLETTPCWPDHPFDPTLGVWRHTNSELLRSARARSGADGTAR